jgi:hypothetical protein
MKPTVRNQAVVLCALLSLNSLSAAVAICQTIAPSVPPNTSPFDDVRFAAWYSSSPNEIADRPPPLFSPTSPYQGSFVEPCEHYDRIPQSSPDIDDGIVHNEPRRIWRFVPTGMVPLAGPRTSESQRYRGLGVRLTETSWLARPFEIGGFAGGIDGDPLVRGRVDQANAFFGGVHWGWDYDHRWGLEKRLGYVPLRVSDIQRASSPRDGHAWIGEYRLMYYPWGDMRWRPYVAGSLGLADFVFTDDVGSRFHRMLFAVTYGVGVKYLIGDRFVLRGEVVDILVPASGEISTMHNLTFTAGFEYRFGLPKRWSH